VDQGTKVILVHQVYDVAKPVLDQQRLALGRRFDRRRPAEPLEFGEDQVLLAAGVEAADEHLANVQPTGFRVVAGPPVGGGRCRRGEQL